VRVFLSFVVFYGPKTDMSSPTLHVRQGDERTFMVFVLCFFNDSVTMCFIQITREIWTDGNRQVMSMLQRQLRKKKPDPYFFDHILR
jgi:hypothetical protein